MAWENKSGFYTLPASTGLQQFRFVTVNTSGNLAYPSVGSPILGVLVSSGTTGSTADQVGTVQSVGVAKVQAAGSTVAVGDTISASSIGRVRATAAGHYAVGVVVDGSSGSTGRLLSVALMPIGTT